MRSRDEAETAERERAWTEAKDKEKAEIARLDDEAREKADPEAEATARAKEKAIFAKTVAAEAGAETRVRVEAKAEVRDQDVGILTDVLNKVKAAFNGLKRAMVGAKEETKEKSERSRASVKLGVRAKDDMREKVEGARDEA